MVSGRLYELSGHAELRGLAEIFQTDLHELICPWLSAAQKRDVVARMRRLYPFLAESAGAGGIARLVFAR